MISAFANVACPQPPIVHQARVPVKQVWASFVTGPPRYQMGDQPVADDCHAVQPFIAEIRGLESLLRGLFAKEKVKLASKDLHREI